MITGAVVILLFFALIGSILYDRKLVKTEKIDAVFGNPERTNGGSHWVIAGSCTIMLLWLYFSWDIARSFHPQSANELCQVAKVRESVLGINYIFPINERTLKSTAFIERETKNIGVIKNQIDNGAEIIQIFDSWAGLLEDKDYDFYIYNPTCSLVEFTKSLNVPVICFPRGIKNYKKYCEIVKPDAICIDYEVDPIKIE